jgi:hypothetical protein
MPRQCARDLRRRQRLSEHDYDDDLSIRLHRKPS